MPTIPLKITIRDYTYNANITVPPGVVTPPPSCNSVITKVDSVNIPDSLPTIPTASFYIYLRGIKEICSTDPTNPAFIKNLPAGTPGTISIGNLSSPFNLTDNGIVDIDLSKLLDLSTLPKTVNSTRLNIIIRDWSTIKDINILTPPPVLTCTPPQVYNPVTGKCETPTPPPVLTCTPPQVYNPVTGKCETPTLPTDTRIVKMLPEDKSTLPDANEGETVHITATVVCQSGSTISKPSDTAYLIIDGSIADRKPTESGIVTFDWQATAVPISIHVICVKVNPSSSCRSPGQDCKRITVSPIKLSISEQLAKERQSVSEQKQLLDQARSALRSAIIGAELKIPTTGVPTTPYYPPVTPPIPPVVPPVTPPVILPVIPKYGDIQIIGLPAPLMPITSDLPIYIYIDDKNVGRITELPKTVNNISVGTHSVYARAGIINTTPTTAIVKPDQTTTVTLTL